MHSLRHADVGPEPVDHFLIFFPFELVRPQMAEWRKHANETDKRGANGLHDKIMMRFLDLVLCLSVIGLRRHENYWNGKMKFIDCSAVVAHMSMGTFSHILHTMRDVSFTTYAVGYPMPDG
jgi:hypothetical protein